MPEVVHGLDAFEKTLREMDYSMQRKTLIDVAKAGAVLVADDARNRAPKRTGALSQGIATRVSGRDSDIHEATVDVGWDTKQFYGLFQEFGTAHHRKQPFLIPALDNNADRVRQAMTIKIESILTRFKNGAR